MTRYVVRNWDHNYEVAQSRKVDGPLTWVALPCKHDGLGFRRIMALPDGPAVYGAWVLIVQVAAKCPVRGVLADERGPLTPEELSIKTGCPEKLFERALQVVSSERVGWLVVDGSQPSTIVLPTQDKQDKQDKQLESADAECPPELREWIVWWNELKAEGSVVPGASMDPPSKAVVKGWSRVSKCKELRELLADRNVLAGKIRDSDFCREGWFCLEKLFGATNRDGEWIVRKLLDGTYVNRKTAAEAQQPNKVASLEYLESMNARAREIAEQRKRRSQGR